MAPKPKPGKGSKDLREEDSEKIAVPKPHKAPGSGSTARGSGTKSSTPTHKSTLPVRSPPKKTVGPVATSKRSEDVAERPEDPTIRAKGKAVAKGVPKPPTTEPAAKSKITAAPKHISETSPEGTTKDVSTAKKKTKKTLEPLEARRPTAIPIPEKPASPRQYKKTRKADPAKLLSRLDTDPTPKPQRTAEKRPNTSLGIRDSIASTPSDFSESAISAPPVSIQEQWPWNTLYQSKLSVTWDEDQERLVEGRGKLPNVGKYYWARTKLKVDRTFVTKIWDLHRLTRPGVLMLMERQSGTFGFGSAFRTETGKVVAINGVDDAKQAAKHFKTKHLLAFGENANFIGTKGCMTCLGVYFELQGNRCFCAHMNIWINHERTWKGVDGDPFPQGSSAEREVILAVRDKMQRHADDYGWRPQDYVPGTLKLVSPWYDKAGSVVGAGIVKFLGEAARKNFYAEYAHGFAIIPGTGASPGIPRGQLLLSTGATHESGIPLFEELPDEFDQLRYVDLDVDGLPWGDWAYCVGMGWEYPRECKLDWEGGKWVDISNGTYHDPGSV